MAIQGDIKVTESELTESEGTYNKLTRKFIVTGVSETYDDTRRLIDAMESAGLPSNGSTAPGDTNLVITGRRVQMAPDSNTIAIVTCTYEPIAAAESNFLFSGGTSLTQTTTQNDIYGNQISVSHTYPGSDADFPGATKTQGVDLPVLIPSTTLTATGELFVDYPDVISTYYVGSTNSAYWAGTQPGYWMCTRCDFVGKDVGIGKPHKWQFTFEFQYSYTGWALSAWFRDQRTGEPPSDLVDGTGIKTVDWYGEIDFNYLFPNT